MSQGAGVWTRIVAGLHRKVSAETYDVSAEEMGEGGQFKREIVVANYEPTDRIDYCDSSEGGHDDD